MNLRFGQWTIAALLCALCAAHSWAEEEQAASEPVSEAAAQSETESVSVNDEEPEMGATPARAMKRQLPDTSLKQSLYLQEHMGLFNREEELTQLSTEKETFFGLFLAETSGAPNGAVLILHDNQQHGHWPQVVAPLREYLPDFGWASLTLELPDAPQQALPPRTISQSTDTQLTEAQDQAATEETNVEEQADSEQATQEEEQSEAVDNEGPDIQAAPIDPVEEEYEPALPRLEKLPEVTQNSSNSLKAVIPKQQQDTEQAYLNNGRERIKTAIEYLQQEKGQLNLAIIGVGQGAAWAVDYVSRYSAQLNPEEDNKGMVIITVDPTFKDNIIPGNHQQMTDISVAYLELLTHSPNNRQAEFHAKRRLGKMKAAQRKDYRQIRITQLATPGQSESDLGRRIRGWLKTNASGTQIKMKE